MNEIQLAETELLLSIAVMISPNSVKDIAEASGIRPNTLYKWKVTDRHLSAKTMDTLLSYFVKKELLTILIAEIVKTVLILLCNDSASLLEQEVGEGGIENDNL